MGDHCRRRLSALSDESGEDHISGLPDELLHVILLRLNSVSAAARTSVLSRRWRRVWTMLPQLILSPESEDEGSEVEDEGQEMEEEGSEEEDEGSEEDDEGSEEEDEGSEKEDEGSEEEDEGSEEEDEGSEEEDEGSNEEDEEQEEEDEGSEEAEGPEEASSFPDTVDAVLAASAAPAVDYLSICVPDVLTGQRIAPWLRFASERVTGEIFFSLSSTDMVELEVPACGKATSIELSLTHSCKLRLNGVFPVLTCLNISFACMDGRDLSNFVSTRCPSLKKLTLIVKLAADSDVSIHSDSLHWMFFSIKNALQLDVVAPRLEELYLYSLANVEIHISAPKLANVILNDVWDPRWHLFTHVCSRLRLLQVRLQSTITPLMKQFNEVDELRLRISIPRGAAGYKSFMNLSNLISKCETLRISLWWNHHGLVPAILHLLRCCNSIKKLSMELTGNVCVSPLRYSCPLDCTCRLAEGSKIDDIALLSLEEVQIVHFFGTQVEMEFVEQLSRCNAPVLKKLGIFGKTPCSLLTKKVREKVRCLCRPNLKVEFYRDLSYIKGGFSEGLVRLD